jgi:hypothetical protein
MLFTSQSITKWWVAFPCVKFFFDFGKVFLSQIRVNVQQKQWGRHVNASIKIAGTAIRDAGTKKSLFDTCRGSSIPVSALKSLMDRIILKTFRAQAGASMDAWKRRNTACEVKGSVDALLRADLKSKVSQIAKKKAGDFRIQKRGAQVLTSWTHVGAKKGKGQSKETEGA